MRAALRRLEQLVPAGVRTVERMVRALLPLPGFGYGPRYWAGHGGGHYAYRNGGGKWNGNHNGGGHYDRDGDRDYDRNR